VKNMSYGLVDRRTRNIGLSYGGARFNAERMPAPDPRSELTRAAPGATAGRAGMIRSDTRPKIWGTVPVESFEGHHTDPAYDVRRTRDGLSGLPRSALERSRTGVVSTYGRQPGALIKEQPSRGLGAVQSAALTQKLEDIHQFLNKGFDYWNRLNRTDKMQEGNNLAGRFATIKRQYEQWGIDDLPELKTLIPLFYVEVRNWFSEAELAARNRVLPMMTMNAPLQSSGASVMENIKHSLESFTGGAGGGLPGWAIPAGVGLLAFLFLRR